MAISLKSTETNIYKSTDANYWVGSSVPVSVSFDLTYAISLDLLVDFSFVYGLSISRAFEILYENKPIVIKTIKEDYFDAAEGLKRFTLLYQDSTVITKRYVELYKLIKSTIQSINLLYEDSSLLVKSVNLPYKDSSLVVKSVNLPYKDSSLVVKSVNLPYKDSSLLVKLVTLPYKDSSLLVKSVNLPYKDSSLLVKSVNLPYKDSSLLVKLVNLPYKDSSLLVKSVILRYGLTGTTIKRIEEKYDLLQSIQLVIDEFYTLTFGEVNKLYDLNYNLVTLNSIIKDYTFPYYLLAGSVLTYNPTATVFIDSIEVDYVALKLEISSSQYCFIVDIQLASEAVYMAILGGETVTLNIDGEIYNLFIESKIKSRDINQQIFNIQCLSPTAKLDKPYSTSITKSYTTSVLASTVVNEMAAIQSITVDYQLFDWLLDPKSFYIQDETPIEVIRKVVSSVGGIIQTKPNGDLLIISEYAVSPKDWETTIPDGVISLDEEVLSISETNEINTGYNAFIITNEEALESKIWLTEKSLGSGVVEIRGFRIPFSDGEFSLETSRDMPPITIEKDLNYIELQIPEQIEEDDPEWEYVEFIEWEGQTSFPIYEIVDYDWIDEDLGVFSFSEDGKLTVDFPDSVPSESLLKIKYKTRFWKWKVSGPIDSYAQIFVPKL